MIVAAEPGLAAGHVSPDHGRRRGPFSTQNRGPVSVKIDTMFVNAFSDAHRWLDELIADPSISITSLAAREHKSERSIRLILSLAFLAPDLAKAATEGNLPRGFKRARLVDLPMLWSDQWQAIGLQRPPSEA